MATVSYINVIKRFGDVLAVDDLTLEIVDGELMVLVGPSGCGKTTTLRALAGLESITSGSIHIDGRAVEREPPKRRDIAMVFQDYALYPQLTVKDNLSFGLRLRKVAKPEIERRLAGAAESLELGGLLDRKPGELSGGQRQRVALGRAIVRRPQVFLMDEPLSNLDAKLRTQTRGEIKRLHEEAATTTVYVTHDQVEAMTLGDRIAVMNGGVLEQVGTPAAVYDEPVNVFVAGFIGSPAMRFGRFEVQPNAGGATLACEGLTIPVRPRVPLPAEAIVGVRPEHAAIWSDDGGLTGPFGGIVRFVEALGRETLVGVELTSTFLPIVQIAGRCDARPGDRLQIGFAAGELRAFDPETTRAIGRL